MTLMSSDGEKFVDVGSETILFSLISTVYMRFQDMQRTVPNALHFLETGKCKASDAIKTAREINLIRDRLSGLSPADAVFDMNNPELEAPWKRSISPVITSCGNLYTTADGKDLLFEIVSLLVYSAQRAKDVCAAG